MVPSSQRLSLLPNRTKSGCFENLSPFPQHTIPTNLPQAPIHSSRSLVMDPFHPPGQVSWPTTSFNQHFSQPHSQHHIPSALEPFQDDLNMSNQCSWITAGPSLSKHERGQANIPSGYLTGPFNEVKIPPTHRHVTGAGSIKHHRMRPIFYSFRMPFDRVSAELYAERWLTDSRRHIFGWQEFVDMYFGNGTESWKEHTTKAFMWTEQLNALEKLMDKNRVVADKEYETALAGRNSIYETFHGKRKYTEATSNSGPQSSPAKRQRVHNNNSTPPVQPDILIDPAIMDHAVLGSGLSTSSSIASGNSSLEFLHSSLSTELHATKEACADEAMNTDDQFDEIMTTWTDPSSFFKADSQ